MKTLIAVALISAFGITILAQRAQNNSDEKLRARNAPDVFVFKAWAFGPDKNRDSHLTIEIGNTGEKTITAVEWEYIFPREGGQSDGWKFRNAKMNLLPDKRSKLEQQPHHYADKFVTSFNLDTVRITRVEYADGSSWMRSAEQK